MGQQADAQSTFAVNLEDGTSDTAMKAGDALERLKRQLDGDTKSLNAMKRAMQNLQGSSVVNVAQFKALEAQIKGKKEAIAQATGGILALGGSLENTKKGGGSLKKVTTLLEQLTGASQKVGGPMGQLTGRLSAIHALVAGGALAFGLVAVAAGITAVTVATLAATAALLKYGVAQANARRAEMLRLEGLTKLRSWYGIAAGTASHLQTTIDKVSGSSALGRDQVGQYAEQLYRMGLRGQNLSDALEGVAIKASVQGDAQAKMFAQWAAGANLAGRSVKKLTDDVKARLGGIAAAQLLDLDVQMKKLHENIGVLFSGLKIEGFLKALDQVTRMLGQQSATGRALKVLFEKLFQPILEQVNGIGPLVKRFFQGVIIGALLMGIGILKVRNAFRRTFGDVSLFKGLDVLTIALYGGLAVVSLIGAGVLVLAGVFAALVSPIIAAVAAVWGFWSTLKGLYNAFASLDWTGMGVAITQGIVNGLKSGSKWVVDTVRGLGTSAMKAFRSVLGIASPSKVFAKLGLALPEGLEVGMERGRPGAQRAAESLVQVPSYPRIPAGPQPSSPGALPGAAARSSAGSLSVVIEKLIVQSSGDKPADFAHDVRGSLEQVLEGLLAQMGGKLVGA